MYSCEMELFWWNVAGCVQLDIKAQVLPSFILFSFYTLINIGIVKKYIDI